MARAKVIVIVNTGSSHERLESPRFNSVSAAENELLKVREAQKRASDELTAFDWLSVPENLIVSAHVEEVRASRGS